MNGKMAKGWRAGIDPITIDKTHIAKIPLRHGLIDKKFHELYPDEFTSMHPETLIHRIYPTYISHPDGRIDLLPDNWRNKLPIASARIRNILFGQKVRHRETWPYIFYENGMP